MCINLNPSICDFLPSRCGVCNSCGCHGKEERWEAGRKQTLRIHTGYRTSDTSYTQICVLYLHRLMILKWEDWTQMCPTHCCMYWRACDFFSLLIYLELKKKRLYHWCFQTVYLIWTSDQWMKWCAMVWCAMVWVTEHDILNWSNAAGWSGQNPFLCTVSVSTHTLYSD